MQRTRMKIDSMQEKSHKLYGINAFIADFKK